jgi:16S rRNA G966 N2-methylase RsmD
LEKPVRLIPVTQLKVPENRQRQEFQPKELLDLQESIEHIGLMHPIVVRDGDVMVAGERRLRAIKDIWALDNSFHCHNQLIPVGQVPCIDLGDLSPLEAMEAELDENLKRENLTWQERSTAIMKLHEFRKAQNPSHTVADTTEELNGTGNRRGRYQDDTKQNIIVAQNLHRPEVAKATSAKEAFKILVRAEEAERHAAVATAVGKTFSAADHVALLGDCIRTMQTLPSAMFDVILTDPPYGMGADEFGDSGGKAMGAHEYDDSPEHFKELMELAAPQINRLAKEAAHLYCFCDIDKFHWLKDLFFLEGWNVFRTPLVWYRKNTGRVPLPEHGPRRQYELILYAHRGDRRVTAIYPDVIEEAGVDDNLGHAAQKPIGVFSNLLRRSARPGDTVLDPFCGTGTIYPAAHSMRVAATGIEIDPAAYGIAVKRLEGLT